MRVLDAAYVIDRGHWHEMLEALPEDQRDIHFEPEYMLAYAEEEKCRALCAAYSGGSFMPYMVRGNEIGNVYCYGTTADLVPVSIERDWLAGSGIERVRYRSHPFYWQAGEREKLIVYMDLNDDPLSELRKGHKSSVMLARRFGVTVEESDDVELFYQMYLAMLDRNEADPKWQFRLALLLKLKYAYPNGFRILIASVDGVPEAGCVLLGAHGTAYYQYAASFGLHCDIGVGNLVVVEAAKLAQKLGYKRLHLGGGLTSDPNDTLLRFKSGFSKRRCWTYQYKWQAKAEAA